MNKQPIDSWVERLSAGDSVALARMISWAEDRDPRIGDVLRRVYPRTGTAYRVGITGPPGGGKSTLIARMAVDLRQRGERVAVVAVDPTSPYTGGALLGDRYRMTELSEDREIFVRSMASRGSLGGMAAATQEALDLLDAAGFTYLLVETVGVGQVELDIAQATDTVIVVLVPESGDGIQAMKAGLMEIGDLFVVNKADREGADRLQGELESMLDYRPLRDDWRPRVLATAAHKDVGVAELMEAVAEHRKHMETTGILAGHRRETLKLRLLGEAKQALLDRLESPESEGLESILDRLARRELTPHDAARDIVDRLSRTTEPAAPSESEP